LEALEPTFATYDKNKLCFKRAVAAPFGPTVVWTTRIVIKEKLIEDNVYHTSTQTLTKRAHTV
ncbi:MAG TPA: hypothetical protein VIT88_07205, partial [Pyrinomonadaceae bacterium]